MTLYIAVTGPDPARIGEALRSVAVAISDTGTIHPRYAAALVGPAAIGFEGDTPPRPWQHQPVIATTKTREEPSA